MRKKDAHLSGWFIMTMLISITLTTGSLRAQESGAHWVTAYYGGWEMGDGSDGYLPISDVDFTAMTDVVHFALVPNNDGTLDTSSNDITQQGGAELIQAAHAAGAKALICVGGWATESGFQAATGPAILQKFVSNIVTFMKSRGYDGVDIDWEPLDGGDDTQFADLIESLRDSLGASYLLTATAGDPAGMANAQKYLDRINIMTYDMSGDFPGWVSWYNSPIYSGGATFPGTDQTLPSVNNQVKSYEMAGIPASKLGIGAEFGGTVWDGVDLPGQILNSLLSIHYDVPLYEPDTSGIMQRYYNGSNYHWDPKAEACYLSIPGVLPLDAKFISYDDSNSIAAKAEYIKEKGLGGIILYELGMGYPGNGTYPLLKTVKTQFHYLLVKTPPPPPAEASVEPNFPNPFSRGTTIPFVVYVPGVVVIGIYNALGERVALLQDGYLKPGTYSVHWSGFGHPSGVYICSLTLGKLKVATKLVLLK